MPTPIYHPQLKLTSSSSSLITLPTLAVLLQQLPQEMSLLTPSESHAFQSFLSSMDRSDTPMGPEWSMYSGAEHSEGIDAVEMHGREALTKATKDLMSLDGDRWSTAQDQQHMQSSQHLSQQQQQYYPQHQPPVQQQYGGNSNSVFPFLAKQQHSAITPVHTVSPPSSSTSSSYSFNSSSNNDFHPVASTSKRSLDPPPTRRIRTSPPRTTPYPTSRPIPSHSSSTPSMPHTTATTTSSSASNKPALLSPSQKKANHIQSEQKRRANIRRGYEALCETVPALREAIRLEEEAEGGGPGKEPGGGGRGGKVKRGRGRGAKAMDDGSGEKLDGRAGPRSENVVLMKSESPNRSKLTSALPN